MRYSRACDADAIVFAHQLDDQAETVLLNLLRGAGTRGAAAMPAAGRLGGKLLLRPLLQRAAAPRSLAYAHAHGLAWIEDESNLNDALTRNFLRLHVARCSSSAFRAGAKAWRAPRGISPRRTPAQAWHCGNFSRRAACVRRARRSWPRCSSSSLGAARAR